MTNTVEALDIRRNPFTGDFPLLEAHPELSYLDSAATTQRPKAVLDAQREFYEAANANPLRGLYQLSVEATQMIEDSRKHVARFIGAPDYRCCLFNRNATEALNTVALGFAPQVLGPGDEVCITIMEHHSNLIPWQLACKRAGAKLVYLYPDGTGSIPDAEISAKIGARTRIVAFTHVSNVLGVATPIEKLVAAAHAVGAYAVVDGSQSVPHMPIDVQALGCDFLAFSGHKVLGPMGIGVLWGRRELLEACEPVLTGGEMISEVTQQDAAWAPLPEKFEAGTQDAAAAYALDAALTYVETVGLDVIASREQALVRFAMDQLAAMDCVSIIGPRDPSRHHGVISFNLRGIHPHDVASILDMDDVAIRAGHHCAQPLLRWLNVENNACCRASLAFYNDADDVARLVEGLARVWSIFN